jgi:membrane protein
MTGKAAQYLQFLRQDLWRIRVKDLPPRRALLIRVLRVLVLTFRGLTEDRFRLRASTLTYYSLMSVVPVLALAFGLAKGFGLQQALTRVIYRWFSGQEEIIEYILNFSHNLLDSTKGSLIAGVGLAVLFWSVFRLLSQMESAFNDIWGIKRSRKLARRITDYLAIILVGPFFFIISSGATVFINSQVNVIVERVTLLGYASPMIYFLINLLPYFAIWLLFTFMYIYLPNTKIRYRSGILAGVLAGTVFQIFQNLFITFQIKISSYNAIYGSFAALPLFIIWLQFSWLIVLFGAEISCAYQNADANEFEEDRNNLSRSFKTLLALMLTHSLVKSFTSGQHPTAIEMAEKLELPIPLVNDALYDLVSAKIVSEITTDGEVSAFQPATDPDNMTVGYILRSLDQAGVSDIPLAESPALETLSESLETMRKAAAESSANKLIKDI